MELLLKCISFGGLVQGILTDLCLYIDDVIYKVAKAVADAFFKLIELSSDFMASSPEIGWIVNRIMILAGVYALFRLGILLLGYLMDPAKIESANKTGTDFVKHILISVALLASSSLRILRFLNS